jgi:hypothetical protein
VQLTNTTNMSIASSSFMEEETGAGVLFELNHRTIIVSVGVELLGPPPDGASSLVMWALTFPQRENMFADDSYSGIIPVPLGFVSFSTAQPLEVDPQPREHQHAPRYTTVLPLGRWEVCAGTRVALTLASPDTDVNAVRRILDFSLPATRTSAELEAHRQQLTLPALTYAAHYWLCGSQVATADRVDDEAAWRPLLHRRWYELKSYVRQATAAPYYLFRRRRTHTNLEASDSDRVEAGRAGGKAPPQPMYADDVREAEAISLNGECVRWADGSVGILDEVKPFYRLYQPARKEKTVRVRRFPHRYADVVGEVPFGKCVEAFGRATDPFTQEQYVLLYLPAGEIFAHLITTYELTFIEEGRYVWGWSKLAGRSGLPLLVERQSGETPLSVRPLMATTTPASAFPFPSASSSIVVANGDSRNNTRGGNKVEVLELPEGTFYTPVREGKTVRIRKRPTLVAPTLREMETNEVRAAVALVTVALRVASDRTGTFVPHIFVQWQQGGYSLLRNATECFLIPVMLSRVPRRFPIRTRSSGGSARGEGAAHEIVDLTRQPARKRRRRSDSPDDGDTDEELEDLLRRGRRSTTAAAASDDSLLSPYSLPVSLQEGLRRGVVRLEDLPPIRQPSEEDEEDEEDTDGSGSWDDY